MIRIALLCKFTFTFKVANLRLLGMQDNPIIEAKQVRSQQTHNKLLKALNHCLKDNFFEHISIAQITNKAGVSVGTFYRRFKNKEALLPCLYQDFSERLKQWVASLAEHNQASLDKQVTFLVTETNLFLQANTGVLRTLHLNSRLYPEILPASQLSQRSAEYQQMAAFLMHFDNEINANDAEQACNMAVFIMVSSLIEKVLYKELTPAIASPISVDEHCQQLSVMIQRYLCPEMSA